jgi:glycine cleavage system H protein
MYPEEYRYTKEHEWLKVEGDTGTIGITHHAQDKLGDIVFVELPDLGRKLEAAESFGTVESVKAVSDLYSPLAGAVTEVNGELGDNPALVNEDPHGKGWLIKLKLNSPGDSSGLLSAADYQKFIESEEEG